MSARTILAIISICAAAIGSFVGNICVIMMIEEINRKRQDKSLISHGRHSPPTLLRIFDEYRNSYPNGKLHVYTLAALALAISGFIGLAAIIVTGAYTATH